MSTNETELRLAKLAELDGGSDFLVSFENVRNKVRRNEELTYGDLMTLEPYMLWDFLGVPKLLEATVLGQPIGKGRPRVVRRGKIASTYTPKKTATWESDAAAVFQEKYGVDRPIHEGIVGVCVIAVCKRPKRLMRKKDPPGRLYRATLPDGDNVLKAVADALQKAGVIRDDKQIAEWHTRCAYATKIEGPCVAVRVYSLREKE